MFRKSSAPLMALLGFLFLFVAPLRADDPKPQDQPAADKPAADKGAEKPPEPVKFVRQHKMKLGGAEVAYTTTAEEIFLKDADGKNTASFFTIAYTKQAWPEPDAAIAATHCNGLHRNENERPVAAGI